MTKVKGFTVTNMYMKRINHETLKAMLHLSLDPEAEPEPISVDYNSSISRKKRTLDVFIGSLTKRLKFTFDQRCIVSTDTCYSVPFGYVDSDTQ